MKRTTNQNIIHSSKFNFEYSTKVSASRGNDLIESIFQSQILPEIEKAISKKVPGDLLVQLSKLEINIGRIDESRLSSELAVKIGKSLETALNINYKSNGFAGNLSDNDGLKIDFLEMIGLFLNKGYLPGELLTDLTLSQLVEKALLQNKNGILNLLRNQRNNQQAAKRLAYNISNKIFDKIIFALNGTSQSLLADYRKTMLFVKKTKGFSKYNEVRFSKLLNYFILEYTLKTTQSNSAKEYFLINILERFKNEFQLSYQELITTITDFHIDTANKKLMLSALENLIDDQPASETLSFENALKQMLGDIQRANSNDVNPLVTSLKKNDKSLFASLEAFLAKDESLPGLVDSNSINELINSTLEENQNLFIALLKKNRKQKNAIHEIFFNVSSKTFDKILVVLEPKNNAWIIEFRKILMVIKKKNNLNEFTDSHFMQIVNLSIFEYLLDSKSASFNSGNFAESIFSQISEVFESNLQTITHSVKLTQGNPAITDVMFKTLGKLRLEEKGQEKAHKRQEYTIEEIVKFLNSGLNELSLLEKQLLRKQLIKWIGNEQKRELLLKGLNEKGGRAALQLFFHNPRGLQQVIGSFTKNIYQIKSADKAARKHSSVNKYVLSAILFLNENKGKNIRKEEFQLFFIYSAWLDNNKKSGISAIKKFLQGQKNIDVARMLQLLDKKHEKSLLESIKKTYSKLKKSAPTQENYFDQKTNKQKYNLPVIKRNIVDFYLDYGYLPKTYSSANKQEIQQIFKELIAANDDFLAQKIYECKNGIQLSESVGLVAKGDTQNSLSDYLAHFFPDEFHFFSNIISKVQDVLSSSKASVLRSTSVINSILIEALAKSKGNKLPGVFSFVVFDKLSEELGGKSISLKKFHNYYNAERLNLEKLKTQSVSDEEFKKHNTDKIKIVLEQKFKWLLNKHGDAPSQLQESDTETKTVVRELAFYAQFNSILFAEVIESRKDKLHLVLTLFKFYSLANSYKHILNVLIQQTNLKKEIEDFQRQNIVNHKRDSSANDSSNTGFLEDLNYWVLLLKFYATNGFFPWWSRQASFSELMQLLKMQRSLYPAVFEQAFLEFAEDEQFFTRLIHRIAPAEKNELKLLLSNYSGLKNLWDKVFAHTNDDLVEFKNAMLQEKSESVKNIKIADFIKNGYLDSELLFKGIYFLDDETILKKWLGDNSSIVAQLKEYLYLSPYFYYRGLSPGYWRKLVYTFAIKFYDGEKQEQKERFHHQFLLYLKANMRHINWKGVFSHVNNTVNASNQKGTVQFPKQLIQILNIDDNTDISMVSNDTDAIEEEGAVIRVANAGIIILWPFLTQLFEHLSFMKNGSFVNHESKNRAVYVLQHLVYNNGDFPEYELSLNKLLVGLKMEEHLDPFVTLEVNEQEMAASLLYGLLHNWEKVKNSTPEGIQETFLQREGILRFQKDNVLLVVEKKGVDVLMESIPWNISVIKLAWMNKPLNVKWI